MSFNKETRRSLGPISKNQKFVVQNSRDREGEADRHGSAPGGYSAASLQEVYSAPANTPLGKFSKLSISQTIGLGI